MREKLLNSEGHKVRPVWPVKLLKQHSMTGLACWTVSNQLSKGRPEINQKQDQEKRESPSRMHLF
jgi:hypothetical protein